MLRAITKADILLFGEFHNNPIAHWLQLEVTTDMKQRRELVLGAEMFEADNQKALTLYVQGKLSAKGLDSTARLWKNYPTDGWCRHQPYIFIIIFFTYRLNDLPCMYPRVFNK